MANYGKYYIAVRLLLLKQFLEANVGQHRYVKRSELGDFLEEQDMPVEKMREFLQKSMDMYKDDGEM